MNRGAEVALTSLVPSLATIPPELLNYALSLLVQSRSRASTLKPEEELGRTYACANLACERSTDSEATNSYEADISRLKQKLRLPKITPRPPCPPRIYKKLYAYLDSALAVQTPRKTTAAPQTYCDEAVSQVPEPLEPTTETPTRRRAKPATNLTYPTSSTARKRRHADLLEDDIIRAKLPVIRKLSMVYGDKALIPHVCAGVRSILQAQEQRPFAVPPQQTERAKRSAEPPSAEVVWIDDEDLPALIFVVLVLVRRKLGLVDVPNEHRFGIEAGLFEGTVSNMGLSDEVSLFKTGMKAAQELWLIGNAAWLDMEWYQNITTNGGAWDDDELEDILSPAAGDQEYSIRDTEGDELTKLSKSVTRSGGSRKSKGDDDEYTGRLQPGLGTMLCPAVDWLSNERRAHYQIWRRNAMARVAGKS